jgi:hypothetical protein
LELAISRLVMMLLIILPSRLPPVASLPTAYSYEPYYYTKNLGTTLSARLSDLALVAAPVFCRDSLYSLLVQRQEIVKRKV